MQEDIVKALLEEQRKELLNMVKNTLQLVKQCQIHPKTLNQPYCKAKGYLNNDINTESA